MLIRFFAGPHIITEILLPFFFKDGSVTVLLIRWRIRRFLLDRT